MIGPEDDSRHDAHGSPDWTEAATFPIIVPERLVGGRVMLAHRPVMGAVVGGPVLWDPTGEHPHDCLYRDWGELWAAEVSDDVLDCRLPNRLVVEMVKPLEAFHLSYLRDECQADLTWVAGADPVSARSGREPGRAGGFEQIGRLTGTIAVRGDILHVDCWSLRERSWGPAAPGPELRSDTPWALDSDGDGFGLSAVSTWAAAHDPLHGTTERLASGWHRADGVTRPLVSGTRQVTRRGRDGRPLRVEVRGEDDLGRELVADGDCVNHLRWSGAPGVTQWWSTVEWCVRDRRAWGESRESMPLELSRRLHRTRRR